MSTSQKRPTTAWMSSDLFEMGIGYVIIARFKASGDAEFGVFLLDVWCLGAKNAYFLKSSQEKLESTMGQLFHAPPDEISPACGRKLVESAVAYALRLGLAPHEDYRAACRVMGGIDSGQCDTVWTFGENGGKPHYVSGPRDSPAFIHRVMAQLRRACGDGNFNYSLVVGGPEGAGPEDLDGEWELVEDVVTPENPPGKR